MEIIYAPYLAHHGVKGMKWGVRRYQDKDGRLTSSGQHRYGLNTKRKQMWLTPRHTITNLSKG